MTTVPGALAVDMGARTISGLAVPYDRSAVSGSRRYRWLPGWARYDGRVPFLRDHDHAQRLGRAADIFETEAGLAVVLTVNRGRRGDRALEDADSGRFGLSQFSALHRAVVRRDPDDFGVLLVVTADLIEFSLTARPAFGLR